MARFTNGRFVWGLLLLIIGGIWLADNLSPSFHVDIWAYVDRYWALLFVYFGLVGAFDGLRRTSGDGEPTGILWGTIVANLAVAAWGVATVGDRSGWFHADLTWVWKLGGPLALILVGFSLFRSGTQNAGARTFWCFMGGANVGRTPFQLYDMAFVAFMGGAKLDLRQAEVPASGEILIDVYAMMGGVDIIVPEHLSFTCEGTSFMGGFDVKGGGGGGMIDHRRIKVGDQPRVRIRAHTLMGGVGIKIA